MSSPRILQLRIAEALKTAGAQGRTTGELVALLVQPTRGSVAGTLSVMRGLHTVYTLRQGNAAVHYCATVPQRLAQAAFKERAPELQAQAVAAFRATRASGAGDGPRDRAGNSRELRRRADHLRANETARAIRGDGTHGPGRPAPPAPAITGLQAVTPQIGPAPPPRHAPTQPVASLPIGQFDTPASPWVLAITQRTA